MTNDRRPELFSAALITWTAAFVALVMRLCARRKTKVRTTWDDYLAIAAFFIGTGFTFLILFKTRWGLGQRVQNVHLPLGYIEHHYYLELFCDMWLYTFSVGFSKLVILGLYWRMFRLSTIRNPIRILFALSMCWIAARVSLILTFCQPIHKFWDSSVPGKCPIGPMTSLFAVTIPHFVLEVFILLCPLYEISKLHLNLRKKIAVAFMFMSGVLVCSSGLGSILSTVRVDKIVAENMDITWDSVDAHIWAVCDVNLASFSTSLPLLRPIFRSLHDVVTGVSQSSTARTGGQEQRRSAFLAGNRLSVKPKGGNRSRPDDTESMFMSMLVHDNIGNPRPSSEIYMTVGPLPESAIETPRDSDSICRRSETVESQKGELGKI